MKDKNEKPGGGETETERERERGTDVLNFTAGQDRTNSLCVPRQECPRARYTTFAYTTRNTHRKWPIYFV